jgi:hypothetical protein
MMGANIHCLILWRSSASESRLLTCVLAEAVEQHVFSLSVGAAKQFGQVVDLGIEYLEWVGVRFCTDTFLFVCAELRHVDFDELEWFRHLLLSIGRSEPGGLGLVNLMTSRFRVERYWLGTGSFISE